MFDTGSMFDTFDTSLRVFVHPLCSACNVCVLDCDLGNIDMRKHTR